VEDGPELLEQNWGILTDKLRISQLRATTKLFLKLPSEMAESLGKLLKSSLSDDETHLHVKDYAAYIYRGLESGVEEFKVGFLEKRPHRTAIPVEPEQLDFNTLEVIYRAKEEKWGLDPTKYIEVQEIPEEEEGGPMPVPE
jgi:hypothetical protein